MPPATEATSATLEIGDIAKGAYVARSSHSSRELWKPNATSRWTGRENHIWWGTRRSGATGALLPGLCGKASEQLCWAGGEVLRLCGTLHGRRLTLWLCTCSGWKAASVEVAAFTLPSWRKPSNGTRRMGGPISTCHQWWTAKAHGNPEHPPLWPSQTSTVVVLCPCHPPKLGTLDSATQRSIQTSTNYSALHSAFAESRLATSTCRSLACPSASMATSSCPNESPRHGQWSECRCKTGTGNRNLPQTGPSSWHSEREYTGTTAMAAAKCPRWACSGILRCSSCDHLGKGLEHRRALHHLPWNTHERRWGSTIAMLSHIPPFLHWPMAAFEGGVSAGQTFSPGAFVSAQGESWRAAAFGWSPSMKSKKNWSVPSSVKTSFAGQRWINVGNHGNVVGNIQVHLSEKEKRFVFACYIKPQLVFEVPQKTSILQYT